MSLPSRRLLLLAVPLFASIAACQRPEPEPVEVIRPVRSIVVQPQAVSSELRLPGELRPRVETAYGFRVGGKIAQRFVSVGDRIEAGQLLARLDPADTAPVLAGAEAGLAAARTDARLAAAELARQQGLRAQNFISQASLDRYQANHDAAQSRLDAAAAQLQQARNTVSFQLLRADVAGHVTSIDAEAGQVVGAGQPVVRVARSGEIELRVDVPERDLAAARRAAAWQVRVPAAGDRVFQAQVRELSPVADPASRTYPMRLTLEGDRAGLALGMSAVATSSLAEGRAFVLPVSALHTLDGTPRVWVVDPATSTVSHVPVRTGGLEGDTVRVVEGLSPGDRVVVAGANLLEAGQKVRVPEAGAAR
ncbi:MAG TPA: efflux RND transporter periplasmic adaptor subunit [Quisquiliibacterium sp.]|nr:efflux RND transporter periplasmic adaptor subunit [Quisquiliibacterium sp.]